MSPIEQAFADCYDGYSADRVIIDPELNSRFIGCCRRHGATDPPAKLNRRLLNLRKRGLLSKYKSVRRTSFPDEDSYRFGAEIAARFMERRHNTSLDRILCDPRSAAEFDELAHRVAPGASAIQYRWAALNLRKSRRLQPELTSRVAAQPAAIRSWSMDDFNLVDVPLEPGLYLFYDSGQLLYLGESDNLRLRLKKHLDHSDNKGFARWLWQSGPHGLNIEIHVLAIGTSTRVRKALELELIRSRKPVFNIQR